MLKTREIANSIETIERRDRKDGKMGKKTANIKTNSEPVEEIFEVETILDKRVIAGQVCCYCTQHQHHHSSLYDKQKAINCVRCTFFHCSHNI